MIPNASKFLKIINPKSKVNSYKLGNIDPIYTSGRPKIVFDGETVTSAKHYPYLASYTPVADDRVLLLVVAKGFVILGKIV